VLAHDGTSRALGAGERIEPDAALTAALDGDRSGLLASADVEHLDDAAGAVAFDLESAAVLAAAARAGIPAACLVAIEGAVEPDDVAARLGRAALAAIAPVRA
jgi:5'-methylthioadenosine phosphorylase/purine-nucleoside phosphorylase